MSQECIDSTLSLTVPLIQSPTPESNKDAAHYQKVTVKAEPMEVDPASGPAPPPSHLQAFSTLGPCEKSEPMASLPEALSRPQKQDLFSQDISVKMASELLFQLSGAQCSL